jgi:group II intron reverse transcriptase/maturase
MKPPNNVEQSTAEAVEGRGRLEGNPSEQAMVRTQSRGVLPLSLQRVNEVAKRDRRCRFTALLHHVDEAALERAFRRQKRGASAGVDGETVASYELALEENLRGLCERVHTGRYRPQPVRRVHLSKPDGGTRPIGVPALEDKIVQSAVAEVLSAIYEADFVGFSYGFRPGRSPHDALQALHTALMTRPVNWILDADVRSFFDSVDHEWLLRIVSHRIADRRILRLVRRWLRAGVMEGGEWKGTDKGTPQGAGISPLLANIFLHYIFDLWVHQWRQRHALGAVVVVRYCDDFVVGFQREEDARRMWADLMKRLGKFSLALHEEKTRLIEFGRIPAHRCSRSGQRRLKTFAFLGFTHYCGWTRYGAFILKRKTQRTRFTRKLKNLRLEAKRRRHAPLAKQQRWLASVLRGHYAYYGLPANHRALSAFYQEVRRLWYRALRKRSQKGLTWSRFGRILELFPLPEPRITHSREALAVGLG